MPMWAWALVAMVASYIITSFMIRTPTVAPATLDDFDFPQSADGTPQGVLFGDAWSSGWMVLWYGNFRTKKIKAGGKGK